MKPLSLTIILSWAILILIGITCNVLMFRTLPMIIKNNFIENGKVVHTDVFESEAICQK